MRSFDDFVRPRGYSNSDRSSRAPCTEDASIIMQTNSVIATRPVDSDLLNHAFHCFLFPPPTDHSLTFPYNCPPTRGGYDNFATTAQIYFDDNHWDDTSQQALQPETSEYVEPSAHTRDLSTGKWHLDHGEHPIPTSWSHASPYSQSPHNALVFASEGFLGSSEIHESTSINLQSLAQTVDVYSAPASELTSNSNVMIGSMYSTDLHDSYTFKCNDAKCNNVTFNRWYDFKRHYNGAHSAAPIVYWCEVKGCPRSKAADNRPFPRKDKVKDHFKSMHEGEMKIGE